MRFTLRLTEQEWKSVFEEANICGLSPSAYIRRWSFGKRVVAKTDLKLLAELNRIGGLLKHIHNETKGAYSAKTAAAIDEITKFVRLLNEELAQRRHRST